MFTNYHQFFLLGIFDIRSIFDRSHIASLTLAIMKCQVRSLLSGDSSSWSSPLSPTSGGCNTWTYENRIISISEYSQHYDISISECLWYLSNWLFCHLSLNALVTSLRDSRLNIADAITAHKVCKSLTQGFQFYVYLDFFIFPFPASRALLRSPRKVPGSAPQSSRPCLLCQDRLSPGLQ